MDLLEECIERLLNTEDKFEILTLENNTSLYDKFFRQYPFSSWGQINWEQIKTKKNIENIEQIPSYLNSQEKNYDVSIYILWGDRKLPIIKCTLNDALTHIDDITPLGMYGTWLYSPENGWVIEFYHEGDITLGFENR